jgi:hypothetical protein
MGTLESGTALVPTPAGIKHEILLHGVRDSDPLFFDSLVEGGNKVLAITGKLNLYGAVKTGWTHLVENAYPGDTLIKLDGTSGWQVGDEIVMKASTFDHLEYEVRKIATINEDTSGNTIIDDKNRAQGRGKDSTYAFDKTTPAAVTTITLDAPLKYYYAGANPENVGTKKIELRAAVGNLSRNIVIRGFDNGYQGTVLVADFKDYNTSSGLPADRIGVANMSNVEIAYCGQGDLSRAGLRIERNSVLSTFSSIVIRNSATYGVFMQVALNVKIENSVIFDNYRHGIFVTKSTNVHLHGVYVVATRIRSGIEDIFEKSSNFFVCAETPNGCSGIQI